VYPALTALLRSTSEEGFHFDFLFSLESTSYSLLGNKVSEDPASYAAKATAWK